MAFFFKNKVMRRGWLEWLQMSMPSNYYPSRISMRVFIVLQSVDVSIVSVTVCVKGCRRAASLSALNASILALSSVSRQTQSAASLSTIKKDKRQELTRGYILHLERSSVERIMWVTQKMRSKSRTIHGYLGSREDNWIFHQGIDQGI